MELSLREQSYFLLTVCMLLSLSLYIYNVSIHLLNNIYFVTIYLDVHCVLGCFCHVLILRVGKPTDSEAMSTLALLEAM